MSEDQFSFRKAAQEDRQLIHTWWNKDHVKEFWDNSPSMWANCEGFLDGKKDLFDYWVGFYMGQPFCLILTSPLNENPPQHFIPWIETNGETWSIDIFIGEEQLLGKGLAHLAVQNFSRFVPNSVSAFIIDPAMTNPRAAHVYKKAGFVEVSQFVPSSGSFKGVPHSIMKMKLSEGEG